MEANRKIQPVYPLTGGLGRPSAGLPVVQLQQAPVHPTVAPLGACGLTSRESMVVALKRLTTRTVGTELLISRQGLTKLLNQERPAAADIIIQHASCGEISIYA